MTWYDSDYSHKKKITIDHTKVDGDEIDFPIPVITIDADLADEANGGQVKNANGYDIIFTNSAEDTQLKHEIELYVNTNGRLTYWVKIPSLSSTVDTDLYIYYGKAGVGADPSTTDTWNSNYISVYHFKDNTDSTSNAKTLTEHNGIDYVNSELGRGADLDGAGDYFSRADNNGWITTEDDVSFIAYIDTPVSTPHKRIFVQNDADITYINLYILDPLDELHGFQHRGAATTEAKSGVDNTDGNYHMFAFRSLRNDNFYIYDDDNEYVSAGAAPDSAWALSGSNWNTIGANEAGGQTWEGIMDEVQILSTDVGSNWMGTTHNTMSDPASFLSWGAEEIDQYTHTPSDSINISDTIIFKHYISLSDTVDVDDDALFKHLLVLIDSISLTDSLIVKRLLNLADNVNVSDSIVYKHLINLVDSINVSDEIIYKHIVALADSIGISDSLLIKHLISLLDTVNISDSPLFKHLINLFDTVNITDSFAAKHSIFILDNISILDDIDITSFDDCGAIFQLQGDSYTIFLPMPEYANESGALNNKLMLFDFWINTRSIINIGIEDEPFTLSGVIFACSDNEETEMALIAAKFLNLHEMMDNNEKIRITGLNECFDAVYVIKDFKYTTIRSSPYAYTWQLTLKYVRTI